MLRARYYVQIMKKHPKDIIVSSIIRVINNNKDYYSKLLNNTDNCYICS